MIPAPWTTGNGDGPIDSIRPKNICNLQSVSPGVSNDSNFELISLMIVAKFRF